jgi:hypothetical protein
MTARNLNGSLYASLAVWGYAPVGFLGSAGILQIFCKKASGECAAAIADDRTASIP